MNIGKIALRIVMSIATVIAFQSSTYAVVTAPNAQVVSYSLAAGAVSAPITLAANIPIHVIGTQLTVGFRGVASVTLLSIPGAGGFIEWVGLDSTAGAAITQGFSGVAGTKILFLDFGHCVQLQVAGAAGSNQVAIRNGCTSARTGRLTLMW